jgi:hypothetical protein
MPESLTEIADGIILERVARVEVYTTWVVEPGPIDLWIQSVVQTLKGHPSNAPYRVIYDFSHVSPLQLMTFRFYDTGTLGLTLQGNEEATRVLKARPELQVVLGITLNASLSAKVSKATAIPISRYKRRSFFNLQSAMKWAAHA